MNPNGRDPHFDEDFKLLRSAVARHIHEIGEHPDSVKYATCSIGSAERAEVASA